MKNGSAAIPDRPMPHPIRHGGACVPIRIALPDGVFFSNLLRSFCVAGKRVGLARR
jgi:hypothetical protein